MIGGSESLNFKPQKKTKFAAEIISELKVLTVRGAELRRETLNKSKLSDTDLTLLQRNTENIEELVKAFKNLVISMDFQIEQESDFQHYFETLCDLIMVDEEYQLPLMNA